MAGHLSARMRGKGETIDYAKESDGSHKSESDPEITCGKGAGVCGMKQAAESKGNRAEGNAHAEGHLLNQTR